MNEEEKVNDMQPNQIIEAEYNEKKFLKKVIMLVIGAIIVGIILSSILVYFILNRNENSSGVDKNKEDTNKIELSLSSDYKHFNNSINDFIKVAISDFRNNGIDVRIHLECRNEKYNTPYCYKIVLDNDDRLYLLGDNENNFDKIILTGSLSDTSNIGKVIVAIAELYFPIGKKFEDEINENFLSNENLNNEVGIDYVYSHMKFKWASDKVTREFTITFSVTENETQDQYKQTEEYKDNYKSYLISKVYNKALDQLSSSQEINECTVNSDTNLVDIKIKYKNDELSKSICASDAQSFVKKFIGEESIGTIQFECINNSGTFYYVKVDNVNSISSDKINDNTKYYNSNFIVEDTNLEKLKEAEITDYKNSCVTYNYRDVLRNPDNYYNKKAYWFGEILQVINKTSYSSTFRVGVSCTKYQYIGGYSCPDILYVKYYGSESFIEDDMVKMYGTMDGTQTYTTVLGASVTVPSFSATYIDLQ